MTLAGSRAASLTEAEKLCTFCSGIFFLTALLTGVWKWRNMANSKNGLAHKYIDTAHRASLMYSFAALLLGHFATLNNLSTRTNVLAVAAPLLFFALAIGSYIVHGVLRDTNNQITNPRLGRRMLPVWATPLFMAALVTAEIGGFVVLLGGFMHAAFSWWLRLHVHVGNECEYRFGQPLWQYYQIYRVEYMYTPPIKSQVRWKFVCNRRVESRWQILLLVDHFTVCNCKESSGVPENCISDVITD